MKMREMKKEDLYSYYLAVDRVLRYVSGRCHSSLPFLAIANR